MQRVFLSNMELKEIAEHLRSIRAQIAEEEEKIMERLSPLKEERDRLQLLLMQKFDEEGIASIKASDGTNYSKAIRKSVNVLNPIEADKWAIEHNWAKINLKAAERAILGLLESPERVAEVSNIFELRETPYVSIRKTEKK